MYCRGNTWWKDKQDKNSTEPSRHDAYKEWKIQVPFRCCRKVSFKYQNQVIESYAMPRLNLKCDGVLEFDSIQATCFAISKLMESNF